jgi:hypothetical protein
MKTQSRIGILSLIAVILTCTAAAPAEPVNQPDNIFQNAPTYPELEGAYGVSVAVETRVSEPNKYGLNPADIQKRVRAKLTDAGIKVNEPAPAYKLLISDVPEVRIDLETLNIESCGKCVIAVRTSLAIHIRPRGQDELIFYPADVWKVDSGMQIVECKSVADKVNSIIEGQVQSFINARSSMKYGVKQYDASQISRQQRKKANEQQQKSSEEQTSEHKFVASKNSDVFHKPDCPFAQNIAPKNLVYYNSTQEAIAAGKRPCKKCNPK